MTTAKKRTPKTEPEGSYGRGYNAGWEDRFDQFQPMDCFLHWLLGTGVAMLAGVVIFLVLACIWQFIHWAAQQDPQPCVYGFSTTLIPSQPSYCTLAGHIVNCQSN